MFLRAPSLTLTVLCCRQIQLRDCTHTTSPLSAVRVKRGGPIRQKQNLTQCFRSVPKTSQTTSREDHRESSKFGKSASSPEVLRVRVPVSALVSRFVLHPGCGGSSGRWFRRRSRKCESLTDFFFAILLKQPGGVNKWCEGGWCYFPAGKCLVRKCVKSSITTTAARENKAIDSSGRFKTFVFVFGQGALLEHQQKCPWYGQRSSGWWT